MKKTLVLILTIAMLFSVMSISTSAIPEGCTAIDVTADVKFSTIVDMYVNGTPIIRDDAKFVYSSEADAATSIGKTPGSGDRQIIVLDFDKSLYKDQIQYDVHYIVDGLFSYPAIWQNNAEDGSTAKSVYKFTVPETGKYEFVVIGCAEIKAENVGNPEKERGFSYSFDAGQKYQVNISNSPLVFLQGYNYEYTVADAVSAVKDKTYGFYQMGCVYNITADLTAGEHTFEYYHLEYNSADAIVNTGNSSRLNFAGFYYQKALSETELANYKYPKAPDETTTPEVTTKAPEPTTPAETTTAKPVETTPKAPAGEVTTAATQNEGGCGSVVSGAAVIIAFAGAAFVAAKKRH